MNQNAVLLFMTLTLASLSAFSKETLLTLQEAETRALLYSDKIKAQQHQVESANHKITAAESALYPKVSLEGSYRYVSEIPHLALPGGQGLSFGDNTNYSVGPMISWNLLDFGQTRNLIKTAELNQKSKEKELAWFQRQVTLYVRINYFKALLKSEQLALTQQSLALAKSQLKDIQSKTRAGAASKIDLLSARKEVSNLQLQEEQLKADYKNALQDLSLTINDPALMDADTTLAFEKPQALAALFMQNNEITSLQFSPQEHPLVQSLSESAEALLYSAKGQTAAGRPKVILFAKSSLDYPNGPTLEEIHQNTYGVNVSIPLFEGFKSSSSGKEQHHAALSLGNKKDETIKQLATDFEKTKEQILALKEKSKIYTESIKDSEQKAKLVYSSYSSGKISFLEVQAANLQLLETKIQSSFNQIQLNILLAQLSSFLGDR